MTVQHHVHTTHRHEWTLPKPAPLTELARVVSQAEQAAKAFAETAKVDQLYVDANEERLIVSFVVSASATEAQP